MTTTHTSSVPLHAWDSITVPVRVLSGIPGVGRPRPHPGWENKARKPWSRGAWPPKDGWYDVSTTWREILDSAMTVGRDPTPWLKKWPHLAWQELLARHSPLSAYLHHDGTASPRLLRPSPVYTMGAERSAQAALAYRLGMTMAEWVARVLIELPSTLHYEWSSPVGAGTEWYGPGSRPDLYTMHTSSPPLWVLEAKGARRITQAQMRKGAAQLAVMKPPVVHAAHHRVLVGTSMEPRLYALVEHETQALAEQTAPFDGPIDVFQEARARLLAYAFLTSIPASARRTVTVAEGGRGRRFSESDDSTAEVRRVMHARRDEAGYPTQRPMGTRQMLIAELPGTGLRIGMSRPMMRACGAVLAELHEAMNVTAAQRPAWRYLAPGSMLTPNRGLDADLELAAFKAEVDRRSIGVQRAAAEAAYDAALSAEQPTQPVFDAPELAAADADLELFTDDSYLALSHDSVLASPIRSP